MCMLVSVSDPPKEWPACWFLSQHVLWCKITVCLFERENATSCAFVPNISFLSIHCQIFPPEDLQACRISFKCLTPPHQPTLGSVPFSFHCHLITPYAQVWDAAPRTTLDKLFSSIKEQDEKMLWWRDVAQVPVKCVTHWANSSVSPHLWPYSAGRKQKKDYSPCSQEASTIQIPITRFELF